MGATLLALLALAAAGPVSAPAATGPATLTATLSPGARLGSGTSLNVDLRVDPRRAPSPLTAVRLQIPDSLGVATSGLGLATCRLPAAVFERVLADYGTTRCPRNSVMAVGDAIAQVRYGTEVIPASAWITVLAGPLVDGDVQLVALVSGRNPFGALLAYAGQVTSGTPPIGAELAIAFPRIPASEIPPDASVALTRVRLAIGGPSIVYTAPSGRRYHPDGVVLPNTCPAGGWTFRAVLGFQDGSTTTATAPLRCPRAALPARRAPAD